MFWSKDFFMAIKKKKYKESLFRSFSQQQGWKGCYSGIISRWLGWAVSLTTMESLTLKSD